MKADKKDKNKTDTADTKATTSKKEIAKKLKRVKEPHYWLRRDLILSISGLVLIGLFSAVVLLSENITQRSDLLPRLSIGGVDVSRLTQEEAITKLDEHVEAYLEKGFSFESPENAKVKDKVFEAAPEDLGLLIDTRTSVETAYDVGHAGNFFSSLSAQLTTIVLGTDLPLSFNFDETALEAYLDTAFLEIETPVRQARLAYQKGELINVEAKSGTEVNREPIIALLNEQAASMDEQVISLELVPVEPQIFEKDLAAARDLAEQALASKFNFYYDDKSYSLSAETVGNWLEFHSVTPEDVLGKAVCACGLPEYISSENDEAQRVPALLVTPFDQERRGEKQTDPHYVMLPPQNFTEQTQTIGQLMPVIGFNRDKVNHWLLENISADIDQPGQNARLTFENGEVTVAQPSKNGIEVDIEQATRDIVFKILAEEKPSARLTLEEAKPEINEDIIDELGINTLIGKGVSDFSGSSASRIQNINVGFEKYSGLVIAPGEEFSVIEHLGPVDAAAGFLPELVIVGKKITPQYGGGLCQVSTTFFRAALDTGLPITDRTNHSFSVSYYKWPYLDWGVEATIYDPAPDLKFLNDTDGHILMQAYTTADGKAVVEFYGTDPERETTIEGPWRLSGSMASGGTTVFNYIVKNKDGKVIREQEFVSVFQPLKDFKLE